jgi:biotin-(acetyl-CoA carboxylase) ligase
VEKIVFETLDSTYAVCRRGVRQGDIQESMIISRVQTEGKGTRNHLGDSELYMVHVPGP